MRDVLIMREEQLNFPCNPRIPLTHQPLTVATHWASRLVNANQTQVKIHSEQPGVGCSSSYRGGTLGGTADSQV
jgi:hypothetical protein